MMNPYAASASAIAITIVFLIVLVIVAPLCLGLAIKTVDWIREKVRSTTPKKHAKAEIHLLNEDFKTVCADYNRETEKNKKLQQQLAEAQQKAETAQHDYEVENAASERLHNQLANANQRLNILEHAFEKIQGECCSVGIALEFTNFPAHWNSKKPQHTETPEEKS